MTRRSLLTPLALALAMGSAHAEDLLQVYEAARAFDATYLAARALAESAPYRSKQAEALRWPVVGATASATRNDREGSAQFNSSGASISARQPLFNRTSGATIDQAHRQLDVSREDLRTAEQDLIVRSAQAYFDVLAAQDTLATTRASKAAITEQLASAKRNFEVGTATITDTREAQARFDLATAQEIAAENDLLTKRIALDQLVGRANVKPNPLAVPVKLPPLQPPSPEAWVSTAESQHPNVRKAQLGLDIAQLETDKARAGHLPTVDAVANVGVSRAPASTPPFAIDTASSGSVGVQLNLPLFAGFSVQNRVRETLALEEKSRNDLEAARRGVTQATRQVFFGVQSGQAQVSALEAAEASSKLALEATQLGYRVGVRVNLDVLNAQTQLYQTQRDLARARYDVMVNSLKLRQAAGTLSPDDLRTLNALIGAPQ